MRPSTFPSTWGGGLGIYDTTDRRHTLYLAAWTQAAVHFHQALDLTTQQQVDLLPAPLHTALQHTVRQVAALVPDYQPPPWPELTTGHRDVTGAGVL